MDVSLGVLWWLNLNNEVDRRDVETAGSDIGSDKNGELLLFEALEGDLSLVLCDVTVHHFNVSLDLL